MSTYDIFGIVPVPGSLPPTEAMPADPAVQPVEPPSPPRPVVPELDRNLTDLPPVDAAEISRAGRERARQELQALRFRPESTSQTVSEAEVLAAVDNPAVRGLLSTFTGYDNRAAREAYDNYLLVVARYGVDPGVNGAIAAASDPLQVNNATLYNLILSRTASANREMRAAIGEAVDRWLAGQGVFLPGMQDYASRDGFRFTPLSEAAMQALRAADLLAEYEWGRIAAYLREMAALTPMDFLFYDPTGLGSLPLDARRLFLAKVDQLLAEADIATRAADLRYQFNRDGSLDFDRLGTGVPDAGERIAEVLSRNGGDYYGQLADSIRQYGFGIVGQGSMQD